MQTYLTFTRRRRRWGERDLLGRQTHQRATDTSRYVQVRPLHPQSQNAWYGDSCDLRVFHSDQFIYEYVGDVVSHPTFVKRMRQYGEEGIRHFYFMMLQKDEVRFQV